MFFRNVGFNVYIFSTFVCLFIFMVLFSACSSSLGIASETREDASMASLNRDFLLKLGEGAVIQDEGLLIRFVSVKKDSRCPKGVKCMWEGDAEILLEVRKDRGKNKTLSLHTSQRFNRDEIIDSFRIKLISLMPYPEKDRDIKPEDYISTLIVEKDQ